MLFSASIAPHPDLLPASGAKEEKTPRPARAGRGRGPLSGRVRGDPIRLLRSLQRVGNDVAIGTEPIGFLDEFAAFDLEDLHPAAAFVVGRGDLQRRDETAQCEVADLLEALFHIGSGRWLAAGLL